MFEYFSLHSSVIALVEGSGGGASLSMGALRGGTGGGSFTGDFERHVKESSADGHLSPWGTLEGGFFTGDFERQVKKGSGNGVSLCMGL
jgi:hypothetical protein